MRYKKYKSMRMVLSAAMIASLTATSVYAGDNLVKEEGVKAKLETSSVHTDENLVNGEDVEAKLVPSSVEAEGNLVNGRHAEDNKPGDGVVDNESEEGVEGTYDIGVRNNITGGEVKFEGTSANSGDSVTFTVSADEGYEATSVGYWEVDEAGKKGKIVTLTADENGNYTFEMPTSDVMIGAAFQDAFKMVDNRIGGTKETDWKLYASLGEAFLHVSEEDTYAQLTMDERFLTADENMTFRTELREWGDDGYVVVGEAEYKMAELKNMGYRDNGDGTVTFKNVEFDIAEGKDFTVGKKVYCVVQFGRDCWVDAAGNPIYRWTYTEDARVIADEQEKPEDIVWLYNLDADSHRGSLIRSILHDLGIKAGTITNENLNQNIGYLAQWDGYDQIEDAYDPASYNLEYMLMCNLSEIQLDAFLDGMQENNIRVNLKSVPTEWTASKTFSELFDLMAEEDAAFSAIFALDDMIYDAEQLTEEEYGNSEHWEEFTKALGAANAALSEEEEQEAEFYENAHDALLAAYLKVTGYQTLEGELELLPEKQEDGTYTISARLNNSDATFDYTWQDGSTGKSITSIAEKDLYKVKLEIKGKNGYYGKISASLSVPSDPEFSLSAGTNNVSVTFKENPKVVNMPETDGYVAQLYLNDEMLEEKEIKTSGTITFDGLSNQTEYTVKVYTYNEVGRSDILTKTITTKSSSNTDNNGNLNKPNFSDVQSNTWYSDAINYVVSEGIMIGVSENSFAPNEKLSRAMLAQILYNLEDKPVVNTESIFTDVEKDTWYTDAVAWATDKGIIKGYGNGKYGPNDNITREQLAVMLYRYAGSPVTSGNMNGFVDANKVSDYAKDAMTWAVEQGVIRGKGENNLDPTDQASRAEVAQMFKNYLSNK